MKLHLVLPVVFLACVAYAQPQNANDSAQPEAKSATVTGILLVNDWRCDEWPENVSKDIWACPKGSSQWGLITESKQYTVYGNLNELKKYERRRVTITGTVSSGPERWIDRLDVQSISPSEMPEAQIRELIGKLRYEPWAGPEATGFNLDSWTFNFTSPMKQILQAGAAAQEVLLEYLDDSQIKDQIMILLGGIGNEKAVEPLIRAMADRDEARQSAYAKKINFAATVALANITVIVLSPEGGRITFDQCPNDLKSCWYSWWLEHRETFTVLKAGKRNFTGYPDYGIYQIPSSFRSEYLQ